MGHEVRVKKASTTTTSRREGEGHEGKEVVVGGWWGCGKSVRQ